MEELIIEFKNKIDLKIKQLDSLLDKSDNDFSEDAKKILIEIDELKSLKDKF